MDKRMIVLPHPHLLNETKHKLFLRTREPAKLEMMPLQASAPVADGEKRLVEARKGGSEIIQRRETKVIGRVEDFCMCAWGGGESRGNRRGAGERERDGKGAAIMLLHFPACLLLLSSCFFSPCALCPQHLFTSAFAPAAVFETPLFT